MKLGPYLLGPNDENQGIYTGDARELAKDIPDGSVDLIFTDPVYQNIEDYRWLAETACRVLKDCGCVIAQVGTSYRYDMETAMRQFQLSALPVLVEVFNPMCSARLNGWRLYSNYRPYLWFANGKRSGGWVNAAIVGAGTDKRFHGWGDSGGFVANYVLRLIGDDDIVFDPFTGGGTVPAVCKMLGRRWLAFEIDPDVAEKARERVRNTQPPLFVQQEEQKEMIL